MTFDEYSKAAREFARYQRDGQLYPGDAGSFGRVYTALGLAGEAGEVCNKIKKFLRGDYDKSTPEHVTLVNNQIVDELGDTLWYLSQLAREMGTTLDTVAQHNIDKLSFRYKGSAKPEGNR